jgi:hypothetical protein
MKTGRCENTPARKTPLTDHQVAGAVALPGFTSVPGLLPPDASVGDGELFGERGGRPAMMSLI